MANIAPIKVTTALSTRKEALIPLNKRIKTCSAYGRFLKDGSIAITVYKEASDLASAFFIFKEGTNLSSKNPRDIFSNLLYSKKYSTKKNKKKGFQTKKIEKEIYSQERDSYGLLRNVVEYSKTKRIYNKQGELLATIREFDNENQYTKKKTSTEVGIKSEKLPFPIKEYIKRTDNDRFEFSEYKDGRRHYERYNNKTNEVYIFDTKTGFRTRKLAGSPEENSSKYGNAEVNMFIDELLEFFMRLEKVKEFLKITTDYKG